MKSLEFEEIALLSEKEKTTRTVQLKKGLNLIQGDNEVGKSHLVKSLVFSLGGDPPFNSEWKKLEVAVQTKCKIGGKSFTILRKGKDHGIFDENGVVVAASFVGSENFTKAFQDILGFDLFLKPKAGSAFQPAKTFVIPAFTYIDQDDGWPKPWQSLRAIQMYKNAYLEGIQFFSGLRNFDKQKLENEKNLVEVERLEVSQQLTALERAKDKVDTFVPPMLATLDDGLIEERLEAFDLAASKVFGEQEVLLAKIGDKKQELESLKLQHRLLDEANRELLAQRGVLDKIEHSGSSVACPLCHSEFEDDFATRFNISADVEEVSSLKDEVQKSINSMLVQIQGLESRRSKMVEETRTLQNLLISDQKMRTAIEVSSRDRVENGFVSTRNDYLITKGKLETRLEGLAKRKKELEKAEREKKARVTSMFEAEYKKLRLAFDLPEQEKARGFRTTFGDTGNAHIRDHIAFFFAWQRIFASEGNLSVPVMVDSPLTQEPDQQNKLKIITAIEKMAKIVNQLIVASKEKFEIDGANKIEFSAKRKLLQSEGYQESWEKFQKAYEVLAKAQSGK